MKYRLIWFSVFLFVSLGGYAQAPVPFINLPLVPDATAPGGADFTLTVNGTGFVFGSVVNWSGHARATTFVNSSQLTAAITAADIAAAGTAWGYLRIAEPAPVRVLRRAHTGSVNDYAAYAVAGLLALVVVLTLT